LRDLANLVRRLVEARFEFVIVGGFAAVAHGSTLLTQDLDLCCALARENLERLLNALAGLHPRLRDAAGRSAPIPPLDSLEGFRNLYLETDLGEIDLLSSIAGVGELPEAAAQSIEVVLWGMPIRILSLDALIKAKQALGRPKDTQALRELETIRERLGARER
jgi:predicted nucleotidyltransferase